MLDKILSEHLQVFLTIGAMIFAAGGAWVSLRLAQRDVNGLGRKVNRVEGTENERYCRLSVALMSIAATEQQKSDLIRFLGGER